MVINILSRFFSNGLKKSGNHDSEEELKMTNPIRWFLERSIRKTFSRECYLYLIFPNGKVRQEHCTTHGDRIKDAIENEFGNIDNLTPSNDIGEAAAKHYRTVCLRLCSPVLGSCVLNYPDVPTKAQLEGLEKFKTMFDDYNINNHDYRTEVKFNHPETHDEETDLKVLLDYYRKEYDSSSSMSLH